MLEREERPPHPERWIWECFERIWCHRCAAKKPSLFETRLSYAFVIIWKNKESHLLISVRFYRFVCVRHEESRGPEVWVFPPSCCVSLLMQRHRGTHVTDERNHTNLDGSAFDCISDDSIIFDQFDLAEWAARLGIYLRNSLRVQTTTVQNY